MKENMKDILSHLSTDIDQETLLLYLQGKLPDEKKHELEKQLVNNEFAADALEGLAEIKDQQQIQYMVEMLNRDLNKKLLKRKLRRDKLKIKNQSWLYFTVIIIIMLLVIAYVIVSKRMKN